MGLLGPGTAPPPGGPGADDRRSGRRTGLPGRSGAGTRSPGTRSPGARAAGGRDPEPAGGPGERGIVFLAWGAVAGRSAEIAAALGGRSISLYPPGSGRRPHAAVRYLHCSVITPWRLRHRPALVVVTNPPVVAGLVTYVSGRLLGFPVALDSHPGGFGAQGDELSRRLWRLHRFLARRVAFSLVAAEPWAAMVEGWGGRAVVVHEAPMLDLVPVPSDRGRLRVLYVGRFARDEPVEVVLEAARRSPGVEVLVTGDPADCPQALRSSAPPNVRFVGFLGPDAYRAAVGGAHAVLTLTTEPGSVMRAAYEAVYAGRPLLVSDWPLGRELFPYAVHVANEAGSIAGGLAELAAGYDRLAAVAAVARDAQLARWRGQEGRLRAAIGEELDARNGHHRR